MAEKSFELFQTTDFEQPITTINFDPIPVGESDTKTVFIRNNTESELEIEKINVGGGREVNLVSAPKNIDPGNFSKIVIEARPNENNMTGIDAELQINASYIISP